MLAIIHSPPGADGQTLVPLIRIATPPHPWPNTPIADIWEFTHLSFHLKTDCPSTVCDDFLNYALELSAQELLSGKE